MNWDAIGAIGEVVGALAVVITLIYFAFQLRQNTRSVNSTNFSNAMQGFNLLNTTLLADPQLTRIFYSGHAAPDELPKDERLQYIQMMACLANIYRNLLHQHLDGALPEAYWDIHAREARQIFMTPGGLHFRTLGPSWSDLFDRLDALPDDGQEAFSGDIWPIARNNVS